MECSIQRGEADLMGLFHLSPSESIVSIARIKTFFVLYNTKKDY